MVQKQKETMESRCYREIKEKIKNGEMLPGTRLIEVAISKELNISRTPVRRAIAMLASDGYIENTDYKGAVVRDSTITKERYLEMVDIIALFLKNTVKRIITKKIPIDCNLFSNKYSELKSHYKEDEVLANRKYLHFLIIQLLLYLKNDYYKQIVEDFCDKIDQFGDSEVTGIIRSTSTSLIAQLEELIQVTSAGESERAMEIIDTISEQQILAAFR
ncbi:GntR family transcriptional regulator [Listeria sp. PSOL-1]|uniref:GntR family transcriptional regulator n=1 Tax=Listeria sp. PSOL-1 TaxID=1844999 RepID=UPI0013D089EF|nr:GntR family transcriptional regulator [Listeria sp. PSOL-1]